MNCATPLTEEQRKLAESHLHIVRRVIYESISLNEGIADLGYEDMYQEGCFFLCKAAATYDSSRSQFDTYAKKVIKNGLISSIRKILYEHSHYAGICVDDKGDLVFQNAAVSPEDESASRIAAFETAEVLQSYAKHYEGITRLGIEALTKKILGTPLPDIAKEYRVTVNHAGAWISRAVSKLRNDPDFIRDLL